MFRLEETINFLRHKLGCQITIKRFLDQVTENYFALAWILISSFDCLHHDIFLTSYVAHFLIIQPALSLLKETISLLRVLDERGFLFFVKDRRLNKLLSLLSEIPYKHTFGSYSP